MWDTGTSPVRVIDHGVPAPALAWDGGAARGIAVINELERRGRRAGLDLFLEARDQLPLDLVGLGSESLGGFGPVPHAELPALLREYRFFFHPARYTSLGLAVIEAMLLGMPVVAPATTEIVTVLQDGRSGIVATDVRRLHEGMRALLEDEWLARRLGAEGQRVAQERFSMDRFGRDWRTLIADLIEDRRRQATAAPPRRRVA
jgi:glycosyltransferase involved in cell wall biosynthesis